MKGLSIGISPNQPNNLMYKLKHPPKTCCNCISECQFRSEMFIYSTDQHCKNRWSNAFCNIYQQILVQFYFHSSHKIPDSNKIITKKKSLNYFWNSRNFLLFFSYWTKFSGLIFLYINNYYRTEWNKIFMLTHVKIKFIHI